MAIVSTKKRLKQKALCCFSGRHTVCSELTSGALASAAAKFLVMPALQDMVCDQLPFFCHALRYLTLFARACTLIYSSVACTVCSACYLHAMVPIQYLHTVASARRSLHVTCRLVQR